MNDDLPKISCLLVTAAGRSSYFQRSLRCYLDQTYPNRELLIVNEGPVEYQGELERIISEADNPSIRSVWLKGRYTLGSLRNISLGLAEGELVCQWDDDDFSMPQRLAVQYHHLSRQAGARICYLSDQLHYYFPTRQLFWDNWWRYCSGGTKRFGLIPGTFLGYRDSLPVRYPSKRAGEDSVFSDGLLSHDEASVTLLGGVGYLHVYSFHGTNQVYDIDHHIGISKNRSQARMNVLECRSQICATIDYLQLEGPVQVMCRDGMAFTHEAR